MNTNSPDVLNLDFEVLVDLSTVTPTIKFTNLSTGPNLAGVKWLFQVYTPNNTRLHISDYNTPDDWTNGVFTFPETLPQPAGNIIWSGSSYRFVVSFKDSQNKEYSYEKKADICPPNGFATGSNFGKAVVDVQTRCAEAKLYVEDKTNYAYKKQIVPSSVIQKKFTLVYPASDQGVFPDPFIINSFTNGLIPISYSGEGYMAILESIIEYDLGDLIRLRLKYKFKEDFAVQCNVDLCQIICEYNDMVKKAQEDCDRELSEKLLLINAKINQALIAKMQPLCKIDINKLVAEIKEIGDFSCDCNCGTGITALLVPQSGSGVADCNAVLACLNTALNSLDPKCLATNVDWDAMSILAKFQLLIDAIASLKCPTCTAPTNVTFDVTTKKLRWLSTNNSTVWKIEVKRTADATYSLHTATTPVHIGNGYWEVDLSGMSYQVNTEYRFKVSAQCGSAFSTGLESGDVVPVVCYNINDITGTIS